MTSYDENCKDAELWIKPSQFWDVIFEHVYKKDRITITAFGNDEHEAGLMASQELSRRSNAVFSWVATLPRMPTDDS